MNTNSNITLIATAGAAFIFGIALIHQAKHIFSHVFNASSPTHNISLNNVHRDDVQGRLQQAAHEYDMGNIQEAVHLYTQLITDHPSHVPTLTHFGNNLANQGQHDHAITCFKSIIKTYPSYPSSYVCLGVALNTQKKPAQAIPYFEKALELHANYPDAHIHMSKSWLALERNENAIESARKALELEPNNPNSHVNLGDTYNKAGYPHKARDAYIAARTLEPHNINAEYGLGYADLMEGNLETAIDHFNTTVEMNPQHYDAHLGLAFGHWAQGDLPKAFEEYEWRWQKEKTDPRHLEKPLWDGSDLTNKTILLYSEQGMGDTIQFLRFAKILKKRGARVVCGVQAPLTQLLSLCPYIDEIRTEYTFAGIDYQAPIMSLGRILHVTQNTIPTDIPYIEIDKKLAHEWREKLTPDTNFKVGLCWHVDPEHEKIKSPLSRRSIPLKDFQALADIPGVSLYSLQKINGEEQLRGKPEKLTIKTFADFDDTHGRFMDTVALIQNLDLVITVDTVVAHLAGALGKPVWTFVPYAPDGRWALKTDKTPWYPSMKLFRQQKPFEWQHAMAHVEKTLRTHVAQR